MKRSTWLSIATVLFAALVAAGCGKFGEIHEGGENEGSTNEDPALARVVNERFEEFPADEAKKAGCEEEVDEADEEPEAARHTEKTVKYPDNPPTSGEHNPAPVDWGRYEEPQQDEKLVHNMEHGHLVLAYKGLSDDEVEQLDDYRRKAKFHLVMAPRPKNPKDGVYYLAWGAKLHCDEPSPEMLQYMIDNYRDQAPELFSTDPEHVADD